MEADTFQGVMSQKWSNAIAMYMAIDWGLRLESLSPPYAEFKSSKTNGKLKFEIYFTNIIDTNEGYCLNTEHIDVKSIGLSDYTVLCIWNKGNDNCVVLKSEDAKMLMDNNRRCFPLGEIVPKIKRKFAIHVSKTEDADIPNEAVS